MKKLLGCLGIGIGLLIVVGIIGAVIGINSDDPENGSVTGVGGGSEKKAHTASTKGEELRPVAKSKVNREEIQEKRDAVVGKTFETLTIGDRQFAKATVEEITDEGIKVNHEAGIGLMKWDQVPEEVQEQWGYDAEAFVAVVEARQKAEEEAKRQQEEMAEAAKKQQQKEEREKMGNHVGAYVYMQMYVEKQLKSPTSADFPGPASKFCRPLGDYRYRVDAYVDSQNTFGAQIRTKFSGIIKENVASDSWQVESLNFYE